MIKEKQATPFASLIIFVFLSLIALISLTGCERSDKTKLKNAAKCGKTDLTDSNTAIIGQYSKHELPIFKCVLDFVEAPDWVRAQLGSTRAVDGKQSAEWGNFVANWSYTGNETNITIRIK